jgi:hypothetical protein
MAAFVGGGLLAGVGAGLAEEGKAQRERALRELEMGFRAGESEKDRTFRRGENQSDRDFRASEARTDRDFKRISQDKEFEFRSGESGKDRDFRASESGKDRSFRAGESEKDRTFRGDESAKQREHQTGLLSNTREVVDKDGKVWLQFPNGAAKPVMDDAGQQITKRQPRERLVEVEDPDDAERTIMVPESQAAGKAGKATKDQREARRADEDVARADARRQAEREAGEKASVLRSDAADFKEDGGSRARFIERRTNEILAGRKGAKPGASRSSAASPYKTPEDVRKAFQDKKLTREQAEQVLRENFGFR